MTQVELELKMIKDYGIERTLLLKYIALKYLSEKEPIYLPMTKSEHHVSVCSLLKIGKSKAIPLVKSIAQKVKKNEDVLHDKPLSYFVTMARETFFVPQEPLLELWKEAHVDNLASPFSRPDEPFLEFQLLMSYGAKTFYLLKLITELFITNNFFAFRVARGTISELLRISTKTLRRILKKVGQRIKYRDSFENVLKPIVYKVTRDGHYWFYVNINLVYDIIYCTKNKQNGDYLKSIIPKLSPPDTPVDKNGILKGKKMELGNSKNVHPRYSSGQNRKDKYIYNISNKDYLDKNKDDTFIYDKNNDDTFIYGKDKEKFSLRKNKGNLQEDSLKEGSIDSDDYSLDDKSSFTNEISEDKFKTQSFDNKVKEKGIYGDTNKDTGGLVMSFKGISKKIYSATGVDTTCIKTSDEILKQLNEKKFDIDFSLFDKTELTPKRLNDVLNAIYSHVGCPEQVFYSVDIVTQKSMKKLVRVCKAEGMTNSLIVKRIYEIITRWDEIKKHPKFGKGSRIKITTTVPTFWDIYNHFRDFNAVLEELDAQKDEYAELGLKPITLDEYKNMKKSKV